MSVLVLYSNTELLILGEWLYDCHAPTAAWGILSIVISHIKLLPWSMGGIDFLTVYLLLTNKASHE